MTAALVLPEISEAMPMELRNALGARNASSAGAPCPECGATWRAPNRAQRRAAARSRTGVLHVHIWHDDTCPAADCNLLPLLRDWRASQ